MITFDEQVAIVTGAGHGLGRSHALGLAERGARVVVNDLGGARDGTGSSTTAAEQVVAEIEAAGGEAIANTGDVTDQDAVKSMVDEAVEQWGRVDILINNAGALRDKSFSNMSIEDFAFVVDVHLMGTAICTKAVWGHMRDQSYGRIVVTTSSSGLYGNFGQANYGAAKLGVVGLMNTLRAEGEKYNIKVKRPRTGCPHQNDGRTLTGRGKGPPSARGSDSWCPCARVEGCAERDDPHCRCRWLRSGEDL